MLSRFISILVFSISLMLLCATWSENKPIPSLPTWRGQVSEEVLLSKALLNLRPQPNLPMRCSVPDQGWGTLAVSASGRYIAIRCPVQLIDTARGKIVWEAPIRVRLYNCPASLAFSPDECLLAHTEYYDNSIAVYEVETGRLVKRFKLPYFYSLVVGFHPDSRSVLSAYRSPLPPVHTHSLEDGIARAMPLRWQSGIPYVLAVSADGRIIVLEDTIWVKNVRGQWQQRICLSRSRQHFAEPIEAILARNQKRAGWIDYQGIVLYEMATGEVCAEYRHNLKEQSRSWGIRRNEGYISAALSPDGTWLLACESGTSRRLVAWNLVEDLKNPQWYVPGPAGLIRFAEKTGNIVLTWDRNVVMLPKLVNGSGKAPLSDKDIDSLLNVLKDRDARQAYEAVLRLVSAGDTIVPRVRKELLRAQQEEHTQAAQVQELVSWLTAREYQRRQYATQELQKMGWLAEKAIRQALESDASPELRRRAVLLLSEIQDMPELSPYLTRLLEILEMLGTASAMQVLGELAQGASWSLVGQEAQAALGRLRER